MNESQTNGKLMCGDVEVTEATYHLSLFFIAITELRDRGLVAGGPDVDLEMMRAIKTVGKRAGLREPTQDEMRQLTDYMRSGG